MNIKRIFFYVLFFTLALNSPVYSQEDTAENENGVENETGVDVDIENEIIDNEINENEFFYLWGEAEGITVYGEFSPYSAEARVLDALSGSLLNRRQFIENALLEQAGFRRTANAKYRNTNAQEKIESMLHGIFSSFTFGLVPIIPFLEVEYDRLPRGKYYSFEAVIIASDLINVSPDVLLVLELEYMLQIEFNNGILYEDNRNYYTEENINKFERLALRLPDTSEAISMIKERYLNIELPRIKSAYDRYNRPSENYLRALQNLSDLFRIRN
jgi:hypothetical protein